MKMTTILPWIDVTLQNINKSIENQKTSMWHTKDFHHVNSKKLKKSTTVNWSKQCSKSTKSDT